jgi:fermentation-respiration switch protein FrsA (DUF1100 family)
MTSLHTRRDVERRPVRIASGGTELAGDLFLPEGPGPWPAVVLTGPFSSVKEQVTGNYAAAFAARGVVALAFDHRRLGASGGEPRCHDTTADRVEDLRDAVSWIRTLDEVDAERLAVCGVCFGAIAAAILAAFDPRVKTLALIAGAYNRPDIARERFGPANYDTLLAQCADAAQRQHKTGVPVYWPALSDGGGTPAALAPEATLYYGTSRGRRPGWENRCTALSVYDELTSTAWHAYPMLQDTPLLVVHGRGDQALPLADAEAAVEAATGPARLVVVEAENHNDLYDVAPLVDEAVAAALEWFALHLPVGG